MALSPEKARPSPDEENSFNWKPAAVALDAMSASATASDVFFNRTFWLMTETSLILAIFVSV
ncbi:hypothetical protein OS21_11400 [Dickeya oryzae]